MLQFFTDYISVTRSKPALLNKYYHIYYYIIIAPFTKLHVSVWFGDTPLTKTPYHVATRKSHYNLSASNWRLTSCNESFLRNDNIVSLTLFKKLFWLSLQYHMKMKVSQG